MKITEQIITEINVNEWAKKFNNTPPKQMDRINLMSISSVKQKIELNQRSKKR